MVFSSQKNYVLIYQTSLIDEVKLKLESVFLTLDRNSEISYIITSSKPKRIIMYENPVVNSIIEYTNEGLYSDLDLV